MKLDNPSGTINNASATNVSATGALVSFRGAFSRSCFGQLASQALAFNQIDRNNGV